MARRARRSRGTAFLVGFTCLVAFYRGASADVVMRITRSGDTESTVNIDPALDPAFSIDVNVDTGGDSIVSLEARLRANVGGVVAVSGGAYGPDWDPGLTALPIPTGAIDDTSATLGSLPLAGSLNGTSTLATLELEIAPETAPGTYAINVVDMVAGDLQFREIDPPPRPGSDFLIVVGARPVPAVGTQGLILLVLLLAVFATAQISRRRSTVP